MKKFFENKHWIIFWRIVRIPLGIILLLFIGLVIYRIPAVIEKQKTEEAVLRIHAQKITLDDVMGIKLPPEPNQELNDSTIEGIDANQNGIRDDVELVIFKEYPDSAKTRAVLLQYAFALQMEATQKIVNKETVTEVVREQSRAHYCVGEITSRDDMKKFIEIGDKLHGFIENKQRNTPERKKARKDFVGNIGSYSESENEVCDINLSVLPN
ncbi:MAG: hypothetical protein Q8N22_01085 [bacterium]|nr:hypothetical protein [bacterium]